MRDVTISRATGYLAITFSALLLASYGVWSRLMGPSFDPFYQAWIRSAIVLAIMFPFMLAGKSFQRIARQDWPKVGVFLFFVYLPKFRSIMPLITLP